MEQKIQLTRRDNAAHERETTTSLSARRRVTVVFLLYLLLVLSLLQSGCDVFLDTVPPNKELLAALRNSEGPVVRAGDYNSAALLRIDRHVP